MLLALKYFLSFFAITIAVGATDEAISDFYAAVVPPPSTDDLIGVDSKRADDDAPFSPYIFLSVLLLLLRQSSYTPSPSNQLLSQVPRPATVGKGLALL